MPITPSNNGFFGANGTMKTDALRSSGYEQWKAERATSPAAGGSEELADKIAGNVASEITEAAVVSISNRLNVGKTGYDSGVSELVNSAVASALKNIGNRTADAEIAGVKGGTYQNEILAGPDSIADNEPVEEPVTPPAPDGQTAPQPQPAAKEKHQKAAWASYGRPGHHGNQKTKD